jgi:hypothetical protein
MSAARQAQMLHTYVVNKLGRSSLGTVPVHATPEGTQLKVWVTDTLHSTAQHTS